MPKQDKDINSSKEIQDKGDRKDHKWTVWSQGPKDAKETKRKFKQTTPGQVRDYKHFVNQRRFQRFEQVESVQHDEEAPVNSVAGGGVDMAPNAKGTKVFMKRRRVDGRTKEYREANRRIKERQEKIAQKQVQSKLDMFGVHANPFVEETENKKYLETKPGSIEDAVLNALNPNADKETLTLPKKNEEEVEEAYKSPLDSPKAKAAREKLQKTLKDIKKKDPDHPAVQNVKEEEVEEGLRAPEGRPKWTEKDRKKDSKERYRTDRVRRTSGGTSGRYAKGLGGEPRWWQSTQKDSPHKQARGVKTKGVKKSSDRLSHATTQSIAVRRKLPEMEEGFGKLKDASKNLAKMRKAAGVKVDKQTTTKLPSGGILRKTTYKKADEANEGPDRRKVDLGGNKRKTDKPKKIPFAQKAEEKKIDELSNKTMDSYAQKATASQADAEKKGDYKKADKRMAGKMRASRRKFSNDTNRILVGLKRESKETENGERDAGSDKYTNYTKEMTPGQGITSDDAKKADVRKKKEQAAQQQQLNVDEDMKYLNTKSGSVEEAILKALMPEKFTTKHEKGDKHDEMPDRKAGESEKDHADRKAGRVSHKAPRKSLDAVDPEELKGKHADRDDKDIDNDGDVDSSDQYLHRRRQAIASKHAKKEEVEWVAEDYDRQDAKELKKNARDISRGMKKGSENKIMRKARKAQDDSNADTSNYADNYRVPGRKHGGHGKPLPGYAHSKSHRAERGVKKDRGSKTQQHHSREEVELTPMEMFEQLVAEKRNQLPRQLKDPKKEKMVGTKTGTKVVDKNDPKYKNAPEHESYDPVDEGSIKGSGSDRKAVLKKRWRDGEKDYRDFLVPGGNSSREPKSRASGGEKRAYRGGFASTGGGVPAKGKARSSSHDVLKHGRKGFGKQARHPRMMGKPEEHGARLRKRGDPITGPRKKGLPG